MKEEKPKTKKTTTKKTTTKKVSASKKSTGVKKTTTTKKKAAPKKTTPKKVVTKSVTEEKVIKEEVKVEPKQETKYNTDLLLRVVLTVAYTLITAILIIGFAETYTSNLKVGNKLQIKSGNAWWTYSKHTGEKLSTGTKYVALKGGDTVQILEIDGNWLKVKIVSLSSDVSRRNFKVGDVYYIYYGSTASKYITTK